MKLGRIVASMRWTKGACQGRVARIWTCFRRCAGDQALGRVVLVTTMWEKVSHEDGERCQEQLKDQHWKEMIDKGSTVLASKNTAGSAQAVIEMILCKVKREISGVSGEGDLQGNQDQTLGNSVHTRKSNPSWQWITNGRSEHGNAKIVMKKGDALMTDGRPTDIVILCVPTHLLLCLPLNALPY